MLSVPVRQFVCATRGLSMSVARLRGEGSVRGFEQIPQNGSNGYINLFHFLNEDRFSSFPQYMMKTFNTLGPIYRQRLGSMESVNIMLPTDIMELFQFEGFYPRRMFVEPWALHRETRKHSKGIFLKNGEDWRADRLAVNKEVMVTSAVSRFLPLLDDVAQDFCRALRRRVETEGNGKDPCSLTIDPSPDIFRFSMEANVNILYGERIGLLSASPSQESQRFISALEKMLATTTPLLYMPVKLLNLLHVPLWTQHAAAWDTIIEHAESRVRKGLQKLKSKQQRIGSNGHSTDTQEANGGVLEQLIEKSQLSLDLIIANMTELMAGGVDTTSSPMQFAVYELARNPSIQEMVRKQVQSSWAEAGGDPLKALQGAPLLKSIEKEILRMYPVPISVQRYPIKDIIIQNYHIPAGTLVQACLYPMGRSKEVFQEPDLFDPKRWDKSEKQATAGLQPDMSFLSLSFGFGVRQCPGRRIADNVIQLLLFHLLLNFRLSVTSTDDIKTTYTFILQPKKLPGITFTPL